MGAEVRGHRRGRGWHEAGPVFCNDVHPSCFDQMPQNKEESCGCCGRWMSFPHSADSYSCEICESVNDLSIVSITLTASDVNELQDIHARDLEAKILASMESKDTTVLESWVGNVFGSIELLNRSFLKNPSPYHVDLKILDSFYQTLVKCGPEVIKSMMKSIDLILGRIGRPIKTVQDCRFLLIYLENPVLLWKQTKKEAGFHHRMQARIFGWLVNASRPFATAILEHFYLNYSEERMRAMVECVNRFINHRCNRRQIRKGSTKKSSIYDDWVVVVGVKFMQLIYSANAFRPVLPISEFYNTAMDYHVKFDQDYVRWQKEPKAFSFCRYPFLMSMGGKLKILQNEAKKQMEGQMMESLERSDQESPFFVLNIRRDHLLEDSIQQIARCNGKSDLKKRLKVQFANEEGMDAGGLAKEWLLLLTRELFSPQYGMYEIEEESNRLWFQMNSASLIASKDAQELYFLSGVAMGLAIYHSILLDVKFPLALYKKLLGQSLTLHDLAIWKPSLARGLHQILVYRDQDIEAALCLTFAIAVEIFGEKKEIELIPGGRSIPVNQTNKHEFVKRYVDFLFNESIAMQFDQFAKGFASVCDGKALSLFDPSELQMLVCGNPAIDIFSLQSITEYERIRPTDPLIGWYWECLMEMSEIQKRHFMSFVTGSDHVPAVEGTQFRMKILLLGSDATRLPVAHTCFNQLGLYLYQSKEQLKEKLLLAIAESEGFGLR